MKSQKIDDIMVKVFNNRRRLFYEYNNLEVISKEEISIQKIRKLIDLILQINNEEVKRMLSYLMINVTKFMEQNYKSTDGIIRFEKQQRPQWYIGITLQYGIEDLLRNEIQIYPFREHKALPCVKQRLKDRIKVISEIAKQEITFKQLDEYFRQIKIFRFSHSNFSMLKTISSYDGKYIFIKSDKKEKTVDVVNLEKGAINNFFYWLIQNNNPYLIVNEIFDINKYLDLEFDLYYCHKAYGHSYENSYSYDFLRRTMNI